VKVLSELRRSREALPCGEARLAHQLLPAGSAPAPGSDFCSSWVVFCLGVKQQPLRGPSRHLPCGSLPKKERCSMVVLQRRRKEG